ncbi:hypothetical protein M0R04_01170 [Candidatus Dojkabacteria bacterium]|jgi:hypothetical protein|nr:hypothetical protein [Candidatus Dojkabacteria bacterium]
MPPKNRHAVSPVESEQQPGEQREVSKEDIQKAIEAIKNGTAPKFRVGEGTQEGAKPDATLERTLRRLQEAQDQEEKKRKK